jgi:SNF2 family DNA or RNA helicase
VKGLGTLRYMAPEHRGRGRWVIEAQPQVMARARRIFVSGTPRGGKLELLATLEAGRDLRWFLERYDLKVTPADRVRLEAAHAGHVERQLVTAEILAGRAPMPTTFAELAIQPRDYQRVAANLLLTRRSLLLADDLGLGKTCVAIAAMTDPAARPALVVTLTHLPRQWEAEIHRFAPSLRVHVAKDGTPVDFDKAVCTRRHHFRFDRCSRCGISREDAYHGRAAPHRIPDVVVLNYHKLATWSDQLAGWARMVVFDEAQELRHPDTRRYEAAKHVARSASYRLGLSASPIYNHGDEIFNVVDIIEEDALGTKEEFDREWEVSWGKVKDPARLGAHLRAEGAMLRRTKRDVGMELPKVSRVAHEIDCDARAIDAVKGDAAELCRIIMAGSGGEKMRGERMRASAEFDMLLRQATGVAKAPYVAQFVRVLVEGGERVVLYGWHRAVYALWADLLKDVGVGFYTGTEGAREKAESKRRFLAGEARVLVMSLRAGAGLDGLQTVCSTVVFGELDWSPGVMDQCVGRVDRFGQTAPVFAYFLLSTEGSDPVVVDVLGIKRGQSEGLRDPDGEVLEDLEVDPHRVRRLAEEWMRRNAA